MGLSDTQSPFWMGFLIIRIDMGKTALIFFCSFILNVDPQLFRTLYMYADSYIIGTHRVQDLHTV